MKKTILICVMLSSTLSFCQPTCDPNIILVVDEELVVGSIANTRFVDNTGREIAFIYSPGRVIIPKQDFESLRAQKQDSLTLAFDYYEQLRDKQCIHNYKLPFSITWFQEEYFIMKIYNLKKRKYKRRFLPLDASRNYTFEIISSSGQTLRTN
jgi:hypothetical protein